MSIMIYVINILFNNAVYISFQQDEKKVYSTLCYRISMSSSKKKKKQIQVIILNMLQIM